MSSFLDNKIFKMSNEHFKRLCFGTSYNTVKRKEVRFVIIVIICCVQKCLLFQQKKNLLKRTDISNFE